MGPLSSAAQRTQKGMARVSVEIQKRVIEPLHAAEERDAWGDMLIFNFCVRFIRESKLSRDLLSYAL